MLIGRVVGNAVSTVKHPSIKGCKLLLVQALQADGTTPEGDPILVIDTIGAGRGEKVILSSDGLGARQLVGVDKTPVRWFVSGICDP